MAAGIAGLASAFVVWSDGKTASSDSDRLIAAAFAALHSDVGSSRAAAIPQTPRVVLASVETDIAADEAQMAPATLAIDGVSFRDRFNSSFNDRSSSFED